MYMGSYPLVVVNDWPLAKTLFAKEEFSGRIKWGLFEVSLWGMKVFFAAIIQQIGREVLLGRVLALPWRMVRSWNPKMKSLDNFVRFFSLNALTEIIKISNFSFSNLWRRRIHIYLREKMVKSKKLHSETSEELWFWQERSWGWNAMK